MKLQARFLLLYLFLFGIVASLLILERAFDLDRSNTVLRNELVQRHSYYDKLTTLVEQPLNSFSIDYSFWDDMVSFVKERDLDFAHENIDTGLDTYDVDMAWVYRTDGSLVYFKSADDDQTLQDLHLPTAVFTKLYTEHFAHFFINEPSGLLEIRAATINPSDDADRKTPAQGYWVVGKYWDKDYIASLGNLTQSKLTLLSAKSDTSDHQEATSVSFGVKLPGSDGNPVAVIDSMASVPVVTDLQNSYNRQGILLLAFTLVSVLVVVAAIWRFVLRPVKLISSSITARTPERLNDLALKNTEFGKLANNVQLSFAQERKLQESEFLKAKLEELNKAKSEFLAIAAHELKSPVGNVHIFAENVADLMKLGTSQTDLLVEVERISQQAKKATLLINDIYQASKGGQVLEFNRADFEFDPFVHREVEDAQYSAKQAITIEGETGQHITSDANRLSQVMTNLLHNAAKYSHDDTTITVRLSHVGNNVQVEIEDHGLGIAPEDLTKLFDRFFRSSRVATTYPGLGLGLSICREIVEALGGRIWVESVLGQGSHFYFTLPVSPVDRELG